MADSSIERFESQFDAFVAEIGEIPAPELDPEEIKRRLDGLQKQLSYVHDLGEQSTAHLQTLREDFERFRDQTLATLRAHEHSARERWDDSTQASKRNHNQAVIIAAALAILTLLLAPVVAGLFDSSTESIEPSPDATASDRPDSGVEEIDDPSTDSSDGTEEVPPMRCETSADRSLINVPDETIVLESWSGQGVTVQLCERPDRSLIYYGHSEVGDILLPAMLSNSVIIATNNDTVYRLDRADGRLTISTLPGRTWTLAQR